MIDTSQLITTIEELRDMLADTDSLKKERAEKQLQMVKIEDELEGLEDDISANETRIAELEGDLIDFARDQENRDDDGSF